MNLSSSASGWSTQVAHMTLCLIHLDLKVKEENGVKFTNGNPPGNSVCVSIVPSLDILETFWIQWNFR